MKHYESYEPFKDYFCELIASSALLGNLKEAKTGKYIVCDEIQAANYGFASSNDLMGITARDGIEYFIKRTAFERNAAFPELERSSLNEILYCENEILMMGESNISKQIIPACSGIITISKIVKQPIFGQNKKVLAICTTDSDITSCYSLFDLFHFYTQYFNPAQAVSNFLRYLNILEYFFKLPTLQEVKLLLGMIPNAVSKAIALQKGLSLRAVDGYKARLRRKLNKISLGELLAQLRSRSCQTRIFSNNS